MTCAGRLALVLLTAAGGLACRSENDLLGRRDGGVGGASAGSGGGEGGSGGGPGGGAPDAAPDVMPEAGLDGSDDAPPNPFSGYRWATLSAPVGTVVSIMAFDGEGALYVGAGAGGIFKSIDGGDSWRPASAGLPDYNVVALTAAGTTMYAGTSDVIRSTDRGASWRRTSVPFSSDGFVAISGQGDLVVAATPSGNPLYVSTDAGDTFTAVPSAQGALDNLEVLAGGSVILRAGYKGMFRSTDRGATFTAVKGIPSGAGMVAQLRCDGVTTCYATAFETPSAPSEVLFKSIDAGATFTRLPSPEGTPWLFALSDTGIIYAQMPPIAIARSEDGGATFTPIVHPDVAGGQACDNATYAAHGDRLFAACFDGLHRSDDKGEHWQPSNGSSAGVIAGAAPLVFVDTSPTALGPDGDIYVDGIEGYDRVTDSIYTLRRSSDGGRTWQNLGPWVASGCVVTPSGALECAGVSPAPYSPDAVAVGRSEDHGVTWRKVDFFVERINVGDDPSLATDGTNVYAALGSFARSTDDGRTFQVVPGSPGGARLQALRNGDLLSAGGSGGYRSADRGATWQRLDLLSLPVVEDRAGRFIRYARAGVLEVSSDGGMTWSSLSSSGFPYQSAFVVPPPLAADGAGHLFVFGKSPASDREPLRIFASADDGATFVPMPAQIPNPNALTFVTDKRGRLLVGTAGGIFRLEADGP